MAKTLTYQRAHRLGKLAGELQAGVPALRPVADAGGQLRAVAAFAGDGVTFTCTCPDGTPEPAVAAVVAAHDPTTPSAGESQEKARQENEDAWKVELRGLLVRLEAGTATAADQRRVAGLLVRIVLRVLD